MKTPKAILALAESYALDYVFTSQGNLPYKRIISLLGENRELPDEYVAWEKFEYIVGKELATVIAGATDGYVFFCLDLRRLVEVDTKARNWLCNWEKFEYSVGKELATVIAGATDGDGYVFFCLDLRRLVEVDTEARNWLCNAV